MNKNGSHSKRRSGQERSEGKDPSAIDAILSTEEERQSLTNLLISRPDLLNPEPKNRSELRRRQHSVQSLQNCLESLTKAQSQILDCVLVRPNCTLVEICDLSGHPKENAVVRLEELERFGLIVDEGDAFRPSMGVSRARPYPAGLGGSIADLLSDSTKGALTTITRSLKLAKKGTSQDLIERIGQHLSKPDAIKDLLSDAPPGAKKLFDRLVRSSPHVTVPYTASQPSFKVKPSDEPFVWLLDRGLLVVRRYSPMGEMPREVAIAARGGRVIADPTPNRPELSVSTAKDPSARVRSAEATAAESAMHLVSLVHRLLDTWNVVPAQTLKNGSIGVREVRRAATVLESDERNASFVIEIAAIAGLLALQRGPNKVTTSVVTTSSSYEEWRRGNTGRQWATIVEAWLSSPRTPSLAGAMGENSKVISPLSDSAAGSVHAPARRKALLSLLATEGISRAIETESNEGRTALLAALQWQASGLFESHHTKTWVDSILTEANALGLMADGHVAPWGHALIDRDIEQAANVLDERLPAPVSEFHLQADLTAVIAGRPLAAMLTELDLIADAESKGAATVFRFSESSLRRAFDRGKTREEIHSFLERHATKGVPQTLSHLVDDIARRHGVIRAGQATSYIRSDDPVLLAQILRNKQTVKLGLRMIAPTVIVSSNAAATIVDVLRNEGFMPVPEDDQGAVVLTQGERDRLGPIFVKPKRANVEAVVDRERVDAVVTKLLTTPEPKDTGVEGGDNVVSLRASGSPLDDSIRRLMMQTIPDELVRDFAREMRVPMELARMMVQQLVANGEFDDMMDFSDAFESLSELLSYAAEANEDVELRTSNGNSYSLRILSVDGDSFLAVDNASERAIRFDLHDVIEAEIVQ